MTKKTNKILKELFSLRPQKINNKNIFILTCCALTPIATANGETVVTGLQGLGPGTNDGWTYDVPEGTILNGSSGQPFFKSPTTPPPSGVNERSAPNGAISAGNKAVITIEGTVTENSGGYSDRGMWSAPTESGANTGRNMYANTIDFGSGTTLSVSSTGQVITNGAPGSEAVNPAGDNNTINNSGKIWADNWNGENTGSVAIWLQTDTGTNYINNEATGIIGTANEANGTAIGAEGNGALNMVNKGVINGGMNLAGGDDVLNIYTGSTITGKVNGAGGNNTLILRALLEIHG